MTRMVCAVPPSPDIRGARYPSSDDSPFTASRKGLQLSEAKFLPRTGTAKGRKALIRSGAWPSRQIRRTRAKAKSRNDCQTEGFPKIRQALWCRTGVGTECRTGVHSSAPASTKVVIPCVPVENLLYHEENRQPAVGSRSRWSREICSRQ